MFGVHSICTHFWSACSKSMECLKADPMLIQDNWLFDLITKMSRMPELRLAFGILQFKLNFNFDVCQDHFVQWLWKCTVTVHWTYVIFDFSFFWSWVKSCARVAKDQLPSVPVLLFFVVLGVCLLHHCDIWICTLVQGCCRTPCGTNVIFGKDPAGGNKLID
jgi:hypothetical protein